MDSFGSMNFPRGGLYDPYDIGNFESVIILYVAVELASVYAILGIP